MPRKARMATPLVATSQQDLAIRVREFRPAYELDPPPQLVDALRQAFGTFFPANPRQWFEVENRLKRLYSDHHYSDARAYGRFVDELYPAWGADDVIDFLVEVGLLTKPKKRRGCPIREVDGLNVDQYLLVVADRDQSVTQLSPRALEKIVPFSASTIRNCKVFDIWQQLRAESAAASADSAANEVESGRLTVTAKGRKTSARGERMTAKERELSRQADAWIAEHDVPEEPRA